MYYYSTRDKSRRVTAAQAMAQGLSEDGGLFLPVTIPNVGFDDIEGLCKLDYRGRAVKIMKMYLDEFTIEELNNYVNQAYSLNYSSAEIAPVRFLDEDTAFLELWHGPTCAFKDIALQMLPRLLTASLAKLGERRSACILVATSGDTGKAALEGFADVEGTSIVVFYPRDGVSEIQELQMTTQEGGNVFVCAVDGNFDDAQTGVKQIFGDTELAGTLNEKGFFLSSANSINWGRLLPQIVYYFSAYCDCVNAGKAVLGAQIDFCVPTGNFGDILAGWYAKKMGLPVRRLICASNSNNVLTDFINTGVYDRNRQFFTTISPSMDILVSSNLERLLFMLSDDDSVREWMACLKESGRYEVSEKVLLELTADFTGGFCDDSAAKTALNEVFERSTYLMDTHTAVAYRVLQDIRSREKEAFPTVIVSTASPFKFCDSVLEALSKDSSKPGAELIGELAGITGAPVPKPLSALEGKARRFHKCVSKENMAEAVTSFLLK